MMSRRESPLWPVVANFYMKSFEDIANQSDSPKPSCLFRHIDETDFLALFNNMHPCIHLIIEIEKNFYLAFLDMLDTRKENGTLGTAPFCHTWKKSPIELEEL